jgi:hypothetical protein
MGGYAEGYNFMEVFSPEESSKDLTSMLLLFVRGELRVEDQVIATAEGIWKILTP